MNFSALIASLIFGIIGIWIFREGKRNGQFGLMVVGAGLMIYPYFVQGSYLTWGVGIAGCFLAKLIW